VSSGIFNDGERAFGDSSPRKRRLFLVTKFSAIYANFAIFLTSEGTQYATASGGLGLQTPYRGSAPEPRWGTAIDGALRPSMAVTRPYSRVLALHGCSDNAILGRQKVCASQTEQQLVF